MARRLEGKVCIVTGANQGIGLATSHELANRGATLWMVCRNMERGEEAVQAVRIKSGNQNVHLKVGNHVGIPLFVVYHLRPDICFA